MSTVDIRTLTQADLKLAEQAFAVLFGEPQDPKRNLAETDPLAAHRCVGAFDHDRIVGHVGVLPLDISVPGATYHSCGTAPVCGISLVFVDTTHRRKGLGKRLMMQALRDATEPVAALWASRPGFYERLGFEPAILSGLCTITSNDHVPLRSQAPIPERVDRVNEAVAARDLPIIYDQARAYRPGMTSRDDNWWQYRFIGDAEWRRFGGGELQHVVAYRNDQPVAYAIYNLTPKHDQFGPNHDMTLHECVGINAMEESALMGWLCQVDLVGKISAYWRPTDDGFAQSLEPRRTIHEQVTESLYVRIINVADAIASRAYARQGTFIVRIVDDLFADNTGVWRWTLGPEGGEATRVEDTQSPALTLDIRALAGIWLGGYSLNAFQGAGLATVHDPDAGIAFHQAFHSPVAPWCPEVW